MFILIIFYLLGRIHEKELKFKRFSKFYLILSLIPFTLGLLIASTKFGLELFEKITSGVLFFILGN